MRLQKIQTKIRLYDAEDTEDPMLTQYFRYSIPWVQIGVLNPSFCISWQMSKILVTVFVLGSSEGAVSSWRTNRDDTEEWKSESKHQVDDNRNVYIFR